MSAASLLKYFHLAYFSKPVADRSIFRTLHKTRAGHLVVIGLGDGQLARKMILLAQQETRRPQVRFTAIDLFEMRTPGLSVKHAHRMFQGLGGHTRLVPGDPLAALAASANSLLDTDLLVIRADQLGESLDRAWFYVPRMLHQDSLVLVERPESSEYEALDRLAIERLARQAAPRRRMAA